MTQSPSSQGVLLEVGAAVYKPSDTIVVTVHNAHTDSIIATDHQTSCTIVQLQMQTGGDWRNVGGCSLGLATKRVSLVAGSATRVEVAPGVGQTSPKPWTAGTYRVAFTFLSGPSEASAPSQTAYSSTFQVE